MIVFNISLNQIYNSNSLIDSKVAVESILAAILYPSLAAVIDQKRRFKSFISA